MQSEIIILIISLGFIIVGIVLWQKGNQLLANGKKTDAVIFKNNFQRKGSGSGLYFPVVRFVTEEQEWVTQELSIGYLPAKPEGTKLQVIYDPYDPKNVEINSTLQLKFLPGLFVLIGVAGLVIGTLEYLGIIDLIPG